jgi:hypothetical protein
MSTAAVDIEEVVHAPAEGAVQGYFKVKETAGNLLRIVGWAFSEDAEAPSIEVRAKDEVVGYATPEILRPDVGELFPGVEEAVQSGFEIALEAHGAGRSELEVEAVLPEGSRQSLGRIAVVVD